MTKQPPDPDLRALFQALRRADEEKAPTFREVLAKKADDPSPSTGTAPGWSFRKTSGWRGLAVGGTLLAAAAAAFLLLFPPAGGSEAEFELAVRSYTASPAGGAWRSPTDALLDIPGSDLLTTLPSLGSSTLSGRNAYRPPSNQL